MRVLVTVSYTDGSTRQRVIDWENREQIKEFARLSRSWLEHGASVLTEATEQPIDKEWKFK